MIRVGVFILLLFNAFIVKAQNFNYNYNIEQAKSMINRGQYDDAGRVLASEAKRGNPEAMYMLATLVKDGKGIEKNRAKAREFALKAISLGYAKGYKLIGEMYEEDGEYENAMQSYSALAEAGDPEGWFLIGWLYYVGDGVECDKAKALEYFVKAANAGNSYAAVVASHSYLIGNGTEENEKDAYKYARVAIRNANPSLECYFLLGHYFYNAIGHYQDIHEASECFRIIMNKGIMEGYTGFGLTFFNSRLRTEYNDKRAFDLFLKGSEKKAQGRDLNGWGKNVFRYSDKEKEWFYERDIEGSIKACTYDPDFYLGICYRDGRGTSRDWDKAMAYFLNSEGLYGVYAISMIMSNLHKDDSEWQEVRSLLLKLLEKAASVEYYCPVERQLLDYYSALFNIYAPEHLEAVPDVGWLLMDILIENGNEKAKDYVNEHESEYLSGILHARGYSSFTQWGDSILARKDAVINDSVPQYLVNELALKKYDLGVKNNETAVYGRIGDCYYNGIGVGKNNNKAVEMWKKGVELGDEYSCRSLADYYYRTNDVKLFKEYASKVIELNPSLEQVYGHYKNLRYVGEEYLGGTVIIVDSTNLHGVIVSKEYKELQYKDAIEWVKTYNGGGHNGWRLPNYKEFITIKNFFNTGYSSSIYFHWGEGVMFGGFHGEKPIKDVKRKDRKESIRTYAVYTF